MNFAGPTNLLRFSNTFPAPKLTKTKKTKKTKTYKSNGGWLRNLLNMRHNVVHFESNSRGPERE